MLDSGLGNDCLSLHPSLPLCQCNNCPTCSTLLGSLQGQCHKRFALVGMSPAWPLHCNHDCWLKHHPKRASCAPSGPIMASQLNSMWPCPALRAAALRVLERTCQPPLQGKDASCASAAQPVAPDAQGHALLQPDLTDAELRAALDVSLCLEGCLGTLLTRAGKACC